MSKLIQKMKRNRTFDGQICSTCFHAVSNHNIEIDTEKPRQLARLHSCNSCKSKECHW